MSRHLSIVIDRSPQSVYAFVSEPANLPDWAAGLADGIDLLHGQWVATSSWGRLELEMAPRNEFGVVDHWVTAPDGVRTYNPMRVLAHGDGAEVVFSLRRADGMSDDAFETDAAAIEADLATLKRILEARP